MKGIQPAKKTTLNFPDDVEVLKSEYFVPAILHAAPFRKYIYIGIDIYIHFIFFLFSFFIDQSYFTLHVLFK